MLSTPLDKLMFFTVRNKRWQMYTEGLENEAAYFIKNVLPKHYKCIMCSSDGNPESKMWCEFILLK